MKSVLQIQSYTAVCNSALWKALHKAELQTLSTNLQVEFFLADNCSSIENLYLDMSVMMSSTDMT